MKKIITLTESDIRRLVQESLDSVLNNRTFESDDNENDEIPVTSYRPDGKNMDNGIKKWVYWSFNYKDPREWMNIFDGAPASHFYNKFMDMYKRYGSDGVMNRFFMELDSKNQENLIDYVMATQKD